MRTDYDHIKTWTIKKNIERLLNDNAKLIIELYKKCKNREYQLSDTIKAELSKNGFKTDKSGNFHSDIRSIVLSDLTEDPITGIVIPSFKQPNKPNQSSNVLTQLLAEKDNALKKSNSFFSENYGFSKFELPIEDDGSSKFELSTIEDDEFSRSFGSMNFSSTASPTREVKKDGAVVLNAINAQFELLKTTIQIELSRSLEIIENTIIKFSGLPKGNTKLNIPTAVATWFKKFHGLSCEVKQGVFSGEASIYIEKAPDNLIQQFTVGSKLPNKDFSRKTKSSALSNTKLPFPILPNIFKTPAPQKAVEKDGAVVLNAISAEFELSKNTIQIELSRSLEIIGKTIIEFSDLPTGNAKFDMPTTVAKWLENIHSLSCEVKNGIFSGEALIYIKKMPNDLIKQFELPQEKTLSL